MANGRALGCENLHSEEAGMGHGKGAGTTEPASVGPAGDAVPIEAGWYKKPYHTHDRFAEVFPTEKYNPLCTMKSSRESRDKEKSPILGKFAGDAGGGVE